MNEFVRRMRSVSFWASDDGARWAFRAAMVLALPIYAVVGRRQWFIRDDWAFLLSRNVLRHTRGIDDWLLTAQDGHWMTPPILAYRLIQNVFGLGSYWPYLLPTLALHVAAVLLTRQVCRRLDVSAWTTTILCSMLLVFGSGWENIVFAIQITYNLSLVAFLVQLLLVDHEGRTDRRDVIGAVVGLIGVMSSGFGPFFAFGIFVVLASRRRWRAAAIAVVPQGLAYGWWLLTWSSDGAAAALPGPRSQVPAFAVRGITATFESLVAVPALAGVAILGTLAITLWPAPSWRTRTLAFGLWGVVVSMFLGVGSQRIGFGLDSAAASRYQHIAAILLVPVFGLAVDRVRHWSLPGHRAVRVLLGTAVVLNAGWLQVRGAEWANRARDARLTYELVVGSPLAGTVDPQIRPEPFNPDVTVAWLPYLLQEGAIESRTPTTPDEIARVNAALGLAAPTGP